MFGGKLWKGGDAFLRFIGLLGLFSQEEGKHKIPIYIKEAKMKIKQIGLIFFLGLFLVISSIAISWGEKPSGLIVVRAADGSLWKATCLGEACTEFTNFPGNLASQPTVYWDEKLQRYVLWGRASDNSIWRSTFFADGSFNLDWIAVPGATASPVGAAGGYFPAGSNSTIKGSVDVSNISDDCNNMTDLAPIGLNPDREGDFSVFANGTYNMGTFDRYVRVCLSDSSGGGVATCDSWSPVLEANGTENYENEVRYALQHRYNDLPPGTYRTIYLKACRESGATGTLYWNKLIGISTNREY